MGTKSGRRRPEVAPRAFPKKCRKMTPKPEPKGSQKGPQKSPKIMKKGCPKTRSITGGPLGCPKVDIGATLGPIFVIFCRRFCRRWRRRRQESENPKILRWCLSQIKGLGPSGVLPLESSRKVSMNAESFSPYSPIFVPIV